MAQKYSIFSRLNNQRLRLYDRMIYDCSFIHINKTGGSSIEKALNLPSEHFTALEKVAQYGRAEWDRRFTFTFVRNPWEKVLSHYHFRVMTNQTGLKSKTIPFRDWVLESYGARNPHYYDKPKMFMPQTSWLCDQQGSLLVDFVGRFENLAGDFRVVCERLGVRAELPHYKISNRPPYQSAYDAETQGLIAEFFSEDVKAFGYAFGDDSRLDEGGSSPRVLR
jgi:chondroitin 4-sulfotransferase 11